MKPLARWTIGNVKKAGYEILERSIRCFQKIYPEFDCIVCYNEIERKNLDFISSDISFFLQTHDCCSIKIKPFSINAWKLFPPRLRITSHELFIDNDLVIHKRIPQINEFLSSKRPLCYGCYDQNRNFPYGKFSNFFSKKYNNFILNSGLFGLPPDYDFECEINYLLEQVGTKEWQNFDEQGLVAKCLLDKNPILVLKEQLSNCWLNYIYGEFGCHFCGHNQNEMLTAWSDYKKQKRFL